VQKDRISFHDSHGKLDLRLLHPLGSKRWVCAEAPDKPWFHTAEDDQIRSLRYLEDVTSIFASKCFVVVEGKNNRSPALRALSKRSGILFTISPWFIIFLLKYSWSLVSICNKEDRGVLEAESNRTAVDKEGSIDHCSVNHDNQDNLANPYNNIWNRLCSGWRRRDWITRRK
jgi:hypothetical protein